MTLSVEDQLKAEGERGLLQQEVNAWNKEYFRRLKAHYIATFGWSDSEAEKVAKILFRPTTVKEEDGNN